VPVLSTEGLSVKQTLIIVSKKRAPAAFGGLSLKIYTRKGDQGETGLIGGFRVAKDSPRVRAYGDFDELNAVLGLALAEEGYLATERLRDLRERLIRIQGELLVLGAELATSNGGREQLLERIERKFILRLESEIDRMEQWLSTISDFIIPGGTRIAALFHLARTVARRAERELVALHHVPGEPPLRPEVLEYANRLSDYLFVCARLANHELKVQDLLWLKRRDLPEPADL